MRLLTSYVQNLDDIQIVHRRLMILISGMVEFVELTSIIILYINVEDVILFT